MNSILSGSAVRLVLARGGAAAAFCFLLFAAPLCADVFNIATNGDTYISTSSPTTNFGTATSLLVNSADSTLLNFGLSSLPASLTAGQITQAILSVWVTKNTTPGGTGVMDFATLTSAWTESSVTFNTAPTVGAPFAIAVAVATSGFFVTVDATAEVQNWVANPSSNFGFLLKSGIAQPNTVLELASRENSINHPANLEITTTTTAAPEPGTLPLLFVAMAALGLALRKQPHDSSRSNRAPGR
jgi:hypothetical protein